MAMKPDLEGGDLDQFGQFAGLEFLNYFLHCFFSIGVIDIFSFIRKRAASTRRQP